MGISTFAHLLTDEEADVVQLCPDSVINKLIWELCSRDGLGVESGGEISLGGDGPTVSVFAKLYDLIQSEGDTLDDGNQQGLDLVGAELDLKIKKLNKRSEPSHAKELAAAKEERLHTASADGDTTAPSTDASKDTSAPGSKRKAAGTSGCEHLSMIPAPKKRADTTARRFPAESAKKRMVDLHKCGALVSFLLSRIAHVRHEDEDELMRSVLRHRSAGHDVCYGPVSLVSAEEVAGFTKILDDKGGVTADAISVLFDDVAAFPPGLLGAQAGISREGDMEDATRHAVVFAAMLRHAVQHKCGLLIHFW